MPKYGDFDLDLVTSKPMGETEPGDQGSTGGGPKTSGSVEIINLTIVASLVLNCGKRYD